MKKYYLTHGAFFLIILSAGFLCLQRGQTELWIALATFLVIMFVPKVDFLITRWLGEISYSLYITHYLVLIIGDLALKHLNLLWIHESNTGKLVLLCIYLIIALVIAHFFNRWIEKPSIRWSKKIRWN